MNQRRPDIFSIKEQEIKMVWSFILPLNHILKGCTLILFQKKKPIIFGIEKIEFNPLPQKIQIVKIKKENEIISNKLICPLRFYVYIFIL